MSAGDWKHIEGPKMRCDCSCAVLCVDFDQGGGEDHYFWDFYTNGGYDTSWRHRLRVVWNLLRGKDHYFHGTVHKVEDMRALQRFLNATLPSDGQDWTPSPPSTTWGTCP